MVAVTVRGPIVVLAMVPVMVPAGPVTPPGCVSVTLPRGVTAKTTVAPATGLLLASRAVTVMVLVAAPLATTLVGSAVTWLLTALTGPAMKVTDGFPDVTVTPLIVADTVTISAIVFATAPTASPLASVGLP